MTIPIFLAVGLIGLILSGLMVGVAAGLSAIIGGIVLFGDPLDTRIPTMLSRLSIDRIDNFLLLAIPFFILAGRLMNTGGITERLFSFVALVVRPIRGGLGHANVLASFLFAGMSGSATADVVGLGSVEMRAMKLSGYPDRFSAGVTAATSLLGPVIPPSIVLVAYAVQAEQSVAGLFLAAIVPGVLIALAFMLWVAICSVREGLPKGAVAPVGEIARAAAHAFLPLLTPAIILAGIYTGVFTPTEAAAIAALYAFVLTKYIYRELTWAEFLHELRGTALDTATLMFIIALTSALGVLMLRLGLPQALAQLVMGISEEPTTVLFLFLGLFLIVGCFMAQTPAIIILTPMLLPIAEQVGLDLVHFGVVMAIGLTLGLLTPPVGMVLYALNKVAAVPLNILFRVSVPYVLIVFGVTCLLILIPDLVLALPRAFGF